MGAMRNWKLIAWSFLILYNFPPQFWHTYRSTSTYTCKSPVCTIHHTCTLYTGIYIFVCSDFFHKEIINGTTIHISTFLLILHRWYLFNILHIPYWSVHTNKKYGNQFIDHKINVSFISKNLCLLKIDLKCCIFLNGLGSHDIVQLHIKAC